MSWRAGWRIFRKDRILTGLALTSVLLVTQGASAQSTLSPRPHRSPGIKPMPDLTEPARSSDITELTDFLNDYYDNYLQRKKLLNKETGIQFSMQASNFGQWGSRRGTPAVSEFIYAPTISWTPFKNSEAGTGQFVFGWQQNHFWTRKNTIDQQNALDSIVAPNAWSQDAYQFAQATYTHTFPGNWLAVTGGQYSFGNFDQNQYAGNAQMNFVNFALSGNATQTYSNAGVGAYVQVTPPSSPFSIAGGLQGATNIPGNVFTANGFETNKVAWFGSLSFNPTVLAGGSYSVLWYAQPSVPLQPSTSRGVSFNASQNINKRLGFFARVNYASGAAIPVRTSVAFGGILNDPFGRNRLDQLGLGAAWNKTNLAGVGASATGVTRGHEWVMETYYVYTIFKGMHISPTIQFFINPALSKFSRVSEVYTVRTTWTF